MSRLDCRVSASTALPRNDICRAFARTPPFFEYKKRDIVLAATYFRVAAIIGTTGLNFCVRDGNRCDPSVTTTKTMSLLNFQIIISSYLKPYKAPLCVSVVYSTD